MSAVMCQQLLQSGVNGVNIRRRIEPQRNATLVGDDNYSHSCAIETADRLGRARQQMKVGLGSDNRPSGIFSFRTPSRSRKTVLKSRKTGLITESSTPL